MKITVAVPLLLQCVSTTTAFSSYYSSSSLLKTTNIAGITNLQSQSDGNDYRNDMDEMRKILEQSWNEKTMSAPPTNSASAALAACESIVNYLNDPSTEEKKVIMVDIALPLMDPSYQEVYDDVGAVEFCCKLAMELNYKRDECKSLKNDGSCAIIVNNQNLIDRATDKLDILADLEEVEEYDDFSDFAISSMDTPLDDDIDERNSFRLASMIGDSEVPTGKSMINDVCKLVSKNVMESEQIQTDDVIIVNAPISQVELVATRWLISRYSMDKSIVIVNNRINPLPQEMMGAVPSYCVLPLIARTVQDSNNPNPKIVVMRRFPDDWQIHIDDSKSGKGFELVSSVPAKKVGVRGPSMEWISGCVKDFMQQRFGA
ncbi:hypothetical protein CTEN210_10897 [Chaetoceros tenuissimus]|uniref:DUF1995 domain-containing protein n=1 Tax=Chaetoceros tenuissimus TaxID=426638 RepID=A0AAD3H8S8_9STRA|nr:hypothetical protein CTEN210_10897 [Chaetoceros tenuissimus]